MADEEIDPNDIPKLIALAAEHDRVDILQDLLKRSPDGVDHLNNTNPKATDGEEEGEETEYNNSTKAIFIPPLHVAIASGSVNASTYLLRVGADPSIRPQIVIPIIDDNEEEYTDEEEGDEDDSDVEYYEEEIEYEVEYEGEEGESEIDNEKLISLRKYHNLSAYELLHHCNLAGAKKMGIEHAFFAEALRCIGEDDISRLKCLLESGMKPRLEVEDKGQDSNSSERGLLDWALDICPDGKCVYLLQHWGLPTLSAEFLETGIIPNVGVQESEEKEEKKEEQLDKEKEIGSTAQDPPTSGASTGHPTPAECDTIRRKLEESQSLALSLSSVLEDLMQETSMCQSLISGSSSSNSSGALVSHVKMMKALIAQKQVELEQYRGLYIGGENELKVIEKMYNDELKLQQRNRGARQNEQQLNALLDMNQNKSGRTVVITADTFKSLEGKLEESQTKVRTLRASLVDITEENGRVLAEVNKLGLSGAIRFARNLKEELDSVKHQVRRVKEQEIKCRSKIQEYYRALRRLRGQDDESNEMNASVARTSAENHQETNASDGESSVQENNQFAGLEYEQEEKNEDEGEEEEIESDRDDEDEEEYDSDEYTYEEYTDSEYETDEEYDTDEEYEYIDEEEAELTASAAIAAGKSTAMTASDGSRFPLDFWGLIWRIIGLSKSAVQETRRRNEVLTV